MKAIKYTRAFNPPGPPPRRAKNNSKLIGEDTEMVYERRQVTVIGHSGDVLTSMAKIRRIVRHALHAGFRMGRGR